jgi:hypothetical protein
MYLKTIDELKKEFPLTSIYRDDGGFGAIVGDEYIVVDSLQKLEAMLIICYCKEDWKERLKQLCD